MVSRRINAERLVLLGWSRAILLQLAHPLVAAGVAAHSSYTGGALSAARRLRHTVGAMLDLTFGDEATRGRAIAGIRAIHDRVNGALATAVGPFPAGTPYSAHNPDLLLWVHISLLESVVLAHDRFVAPLAPDVRDAYCAEAAPVALDLGARPADVPRSWDALLAAVARVHASGVLVVSDDARRIASAVLAPPMRAFVWPAARVNRQFTIGSLPLDVRRQYGYEWTASDDASLDRLTRLVHVGRAVLPGVALRWRASGW
jgi:uncharacterized protein (DUF2236 family)